MKCLADKHDGVRTECRGIHIESEYTISRKHGVDVSSLWTESVDVAGMKAVGLPVVKQAA
jgi:hypothetical protein